MNKRHLVTALIAFLAAIAGVLIGRLVIPAVSAPTAELHAVLHDRLSLDREQTRAIDALEQRFAVRRRALEAEMRAENRRLALAIDAEHGNGPQVAAAIDASHRTMGQLQKETLVHVFAMRALLRPDQVPVFDDAVKRALTEDQQ